MDKTYAVRVQVVDLANGAVVASGECLTDTTDLEDVILSAKVAAALSIPKHVAPVEVEATI